MGVKKESGQFFLAVSSIIAIVLIVAFMTNGMGGTILGQAIFSNSQNNIDSNWVSIQSYTELDLDLLFESGGFLFLSTSFDMLHQQNIHFFAIEPQSHLDIYVDGNRIYFASNQLVYVWYYNEQTNRWTNEWGVFFENTWARTADGSPILI